MRVANVLRSRVSSPRAGVHRTRSNFPTISSSVFPACGGSPLDLQFADVSLECLPRVRGFTCFGPAAKIGYGVSSPRAGVHVPPHTMPALAKTDRATGQTRSLVGHSLDVAHCVHAMLRRGVCRERLGMAAGIQLTD